MIDVEVEDAAWTEAEPDCEALALAAATASLEDQDMAAGGVAILLTSDEAVRDLNARFRAQDKPTNVLSFPAVLNEEGHLGDIALALGVCAREATEQGKPLADHLRHLVVHGVLHLLSYDHEDDAEAQEMEAREAAILAGLGVADPYRLERD